MIEYIIHLPDFLLIRWANASEDNAAVRLIDEELDARHEAIREEVECHAQESPF